MSIRKTPLAIAVVASLAALAAPASAEPSYTYTAYNCLAKAEVDVTLTVAGGKIVVKPDGKIDISSVLGTPTADDELEWVVKSRYREGRVRKEVVSRGDVALKSSVSGATKLDNKKGKWEDLLNDPDYIRALELGLTKNAHTPAETAHPIVSLDEEGCAPE